MHSRITKVISKALCGVSLPDCRASDEHMVSHTKTGNGSGRLNVWARGRNEDKQRQLPKSWHPPMYCFTKCFLVLCFLFGMRACGKDISSPHMYFPYFLQE